MERIVKNMESPLTGGPVKEVMTTERLSFRGEEFDVVAWYYVCIDTGEKFTTAETDTLCLNDIYSQYRNRHGIPSPQEIKSIREHYDLNYRQISTILGLGRNNYARYEKGEVPSESNGKAIAQLKSHEALLNYLLNSRDEFDKEEYDKIRNRVLLAGDLNRDALTPYFASINNSLYNGFVDFSFLKASEMVLYVLSKTKGGCYKSKLNKLMFYSDYYHFRNTGYSISGLQYMAISFGPVPKCYDTLYDNIPEIEREYTQAHGDVAALLKAQPFVPSLLDETEQDAINKVMTAIGDMPTISVEEESHKESIWKEFVDNHRLIPYSQAYNLQML